MKLIFKIMGLVLVVAACTSNRDRTSSVDQVDKDSLAYVIINIALTDTLAGRKKEHQIVSEIPWLPPPNQHEGTDVGYVSKNLSELDTMCIHAQMRGAGKFKTNKMTKYGFTIVDLDKFRDTHAPNSAFWERFHEKYGSGFYTVSKPIFNCNRTRAFIRVGHLCGSECGGGSEMILEKVNGLWEIKEKISSWVS
jgi:hypothetical protein